MKNVSILFLFLAISLAFLSCQDKPTPVNTLSENEISEGWKLLFDGKTTEGWHLYNRGNTPSAWIVKDDELLCNPDTFEVEHGDLLSNVTYENFDLKFDWKISEAGNSGVFINVQEAEQYPRAWTTGPELQLLDNLGIHKEYLNDTTHWAGCLYGFKSTLNAATYKPAGQWNDARILQENGKVSFWLNGVQTAEQDLKTPEWQEMVAKSGFKTFSDYGKSTKGHIALQDWSKGVSFRNIKIKSL
ncbi:DUF1080 domain-containing protein [Lacihabitans sp. LS3-19]|uniref:3-keto-disaccharide hydrolase n=1 Tax=Lacihabitans sp. LS3-19 TaxID=2487335 RepID=UPI0020CC113B|nr:DUF1080 domain-containing protein [Lacihabitans sp. LS3-19]MCP9767818.1 DUF1080 domain-containing protein [Lacihabitans sp. LS3-19]